MSDEVENDRLIERFTETRAQRAARMAEPVDDETRERFRRAGFTDETSF